MKQPLNEQFRRMQKLAGIITENEYKQPIKENKIGNIDVDLAKKIQNTPEIKKLANALKSNKTLMDNALKFVAKVAKNVWINGALSYSPSVSTAFGSTPSVAGRLGVFFQF